MGGVAGCRLAVGHYPLVAGFDMSHGQRTADTYSYSPTFSMPEQDRAERNAISLYYAMISPARHICSNIRPDVEPIICLVGNTDMHSTAFPVLDAKS